jgi:dinuclear metal center YbgI/SA1388 family protein
MPVDRITLVKYLNELLNIEKIEDRSCNGLQMQGTDKITRIGLAVDACLGAYEKAVEQHCQMIIVHHGLIWSGLTSITGAVYRQVKYLADSGLNLYGAHLPLDAHPEYGNNIVLARMLNLIDVKPFGCYRNTAIGFEGTLPRPLSSEAIGNTIQAAIGGKFSVLPFGKPENKRVAVVSGGGTDAMDEAIDKNIDCFLTGEGVHANHHKALESRLNVVYCGHYETETVGVKALGKYLEKQFDVETVFLDVPTLV